MTAAQVWKGGCQLSRSEMKEGWFVERQEYLVRISRCCRLERAWQEMEKEKERGTDEKEEREKQAS